TVFAAATPPRLTSRSAPLPRAPSVDSCPGSDAAPAGAGDVPKPRRDQHQSRVAIRERSNHPCATPDLPVQPLQRIVRPQHSPVLPRALLTGSGLAYTHHHLPSGGLRFHMCAMIGTLP